MYKYIREASRDKHLTIADIKNLEVGEEFDCVLWDRNFEEYGIWNKVESEKLYKATKFFESNRVRIKYLGDMKWLLKMDCGEFLHMIHIDTSKLHDKWKWMPLDSDQILRLESNCSRCSKNSKSKKGIKWKNLPTNTRVGWRGPMMLWKHLESAPKIYYEEGYYGSETES